MSLPRRPSPPVSADLLTGERTWPGIPRENYWFMRHLACYRWAADVIESRGGHGSLLDAGSGEGYGAADLAHRIGRSVVAVELDTPTVHHSADRYRAVGHVRANLVSLPFDADVFAAAVSFQVIEHIWDPVTFARELDRCTRGPILISTPNRPVHSPHLARGQRPDNPFHVREFDAQELLEILEVASAQRTAAVFGLLHGPRIKAWESEYGSLPTALNDERDSTAAGIFASTVEYSDFVIEPIHANSTESSAHDLVAIW